MRIKYSIITIVLAFCFTSLLAQQRGKATYYSKRSTGRMTSSGQKIHHDSMTCAHRFFPFGTLLKVKNINNGKVVTVKVTDRGPFARGRIIDLSWGAARELGILNKGVAVVEVELLDDTVIPFRPKEEDITILDLQLAGDDSYYAIPEWQSTGVTTKKLPLKMKK